MKGSDAAAAYAAMLAGPTRIGLGCMALTGLYGRVSRDQAEATVKTALSKGFRLFDTAPLYGDGANEELLGALLARESDVCIATKFGLYSGRDGKTIRDSSPSLIRRSVEDSLRRLRRERIDLLLQHRRDAQTSDDDVAGVITDLVREGKVRGFGLSETDVARATRMDRNFPVNAVQNEFSLLARPELNADPRNFAANGLAYIAYSPLAKGLLASIATRMFFAEDDYRSQLNEFRSGTASGIHPVLATIARYSVRYGVQPATVSLAWIIARVESVVAIPGARSPEQVAVAYQASELRLNGEDLKSLDNAFRNEALIQSD